MMHGVTPLLDDQRDNLRHVTLCRPAAEEKKKGQVPSPASASHWTTRLPPKKIVSSCGICVLALFLVVAVRFWLGGNRRDNACHTQTSH